MKYNVSDSKFFKELTTLPYVEEIWLYGSRAHGNQSDRSDIDLAIICPNATEKDWQNIMAIIEDADTLLAIDCLRFDQLRKTEKIRENIRHISIK